MSTTIKGPRTAAEAAGKEPEPVPEAMNLMNMGPNRAGATVQSENRSYKDIMDSMRRMAQADESKFYK
jgi:hypothetical protein